MSLEQTPGESPLAMERLSPSFPIRKMTFLLDGSAETTLLKEKIQLQLERDPIFKVSNQHDLTLKEVRERTMQKIARLAHYIATEPLDIFKLRMEIIGLLDPGTYTRIGVHYGLFFATLSGQATSQQLSYWVQKGALALNGVIGCFAMTELGHGSNVAGLETTATFDEASDEFIIHTPTLTATKWWIGGAAQTATHAVVFAQMIVKGKNYGVKNFVVQLRDPSDFKVRPGINIGDIGAKMGRHGIDNGWIQFTHLHVPRSHMLMRYTQVNRQGDVTEPPLAQLAYGALIKGRVSMITDSSNFAKKALTIAVRYAAVRRQFGARKNKPETKILDYIIHQHRLMPLLAETFAMHFASAQVSIIYENLMLSMENMKAGESNNIVLENLKEVHGTSAGLKAFCTWSCLSIIDQCRQSCGGHGYSSYAGLASLYNDFAVQCTWEGDNTILTLQAGRYLIGCYRDAKAGIHQPGGVSYLNNLSETLKKKCSAKTPSEILDLEVIGQAFDLVAANVVKKAGEEFQAHVAKGCHEEVAYEQCSQPRLYAAKIHSYSYLFHSFKSAIIKTPVELQSILTKLCLLYGLYTIQENSGAFLQYEFFTSEQMDWVISAVSSFCKDVRKDAIPLVDSFNLSDFLVNSPLGRYDGNVYEHYFRMVNSAHAPGVVPPYFDSIIKPLLSKKINDEDSLELDE